MRRSRLLLTTEDFADLTPALSGACATISSDALMNPFDGKRLYPSCSKFNLTLVSSYQATNAGPWINLPLDISLRTVPLSYRRANRFLRFLSYHLMHDHSLYCHTVHGVRVAIEVYESSKRVRSIHALYGWWTRRSVRCRDHNAVGCH